MSHEGAFPSYSPHGSLGSPLTYSFSTIQDFPILPSSSSMSEYPALTQLSPGYHNSPPIPAPRGQSPWTAYPASGPSSGRYHPTSSYSPTVSNAPLHMGGGYYCSPPHAPQGITHKQTSSHKQESKPNGRAKSLPATKAARQKPPPQFCHSSNSNPQEQQEDARPKTSSENPPTKLDQSTTAATSAHSRHTSTNKKQRPQAQPTAQQGAYNLHHIRRLRSVYGYTRACDIFVCIFAHTHMVPMCIIFAEHALSITTQKGLHKVIFEHPKIHFCFHECEKRRSLNQT